MERPSKSLVLELTFSFELTLAVINDYDRKSCLFCKFLLDCCVLRVPQDPQDPLIVSLKMIQQQ